VADAAPGPRARAGCGRGTARDGLCRGPACLARPSPAARRHVPRPHGVV